MTTPEPASTSTERAGPTGAALRVQGLVKRFGDTTALDGVDLVAERGTILGLLGPNGAGKTTVVRVLSTLLAPDAGTVEVAGHDVATDGAGVRSVLGLTGQFAAVDDALTGRENLVLFARLRRLDKAQATARAAELLALFDLDDAADRRAKTYSGGMRRRLDLAASLVVEPEVLVLDEPTTGLDPRSRMALWDVIRDLRAKGITVLLTTQYLEEADQLAERIVVIDHGRVIAEGTAADLKARVGGTTLEVVLVDPGATEAARAAVAGVVDQAPHVDADAGRISVPVDQPVEALGRALLALRDADLAVADIGLRQPTLDDVFLALTGQPAEPRAGDDVTGDLGDLGDLGDAQEVRS